MYFFLEICIFSPTVPNQWSPTRRIRVFEIRTLEEKFTIVQKITDIFRKLNRISNTIFSLRRLVHDINGSIYIPANFSNDRSIFPTSLQWTSFLEPRSWNPLPPPLRNAFENPPRVQWNELISMERCNRGLARSREGGEIRGGSQKRSVEKFKRSQLRLIAVLAVSSASRKCGPVTSLDATLHAATGGGGCVARWNERRPTPSPSFHVPVHVPRQIAAND